MKTTITVGEALLMSAFIFLANCSNDKENQAPPNSPITATGESFAALREDALASMTQHFTISDSGSSANFTSEKGVFITVQPNSFTLNGSVIGGTVELDFIEIFDNADMLMTNKPTMGKAADGKRKMLLSGGEFYVKATKNGHKLEIVKKLFMEIPISLTGIANEQMTLWKGAVDTLHVQKDLVWDNVIENGQANGGGDFVIHDGMYNIGYAFNGNFPWANVDCFYIDPRPKTTILAKVPNGYDQKNSAVYLSYDGQGNGLAQLDTFTAQGLFSEHYGQIPIGLECHAIFITEENGLYKYAIKAVTIIADGTITFTVAEMTTGTKSQLEAAIRAVQG